MSELQNPFAAKRIVSSILDDVDQLRDFAEIGPPLFSIVNIQSSYRFLATGNYIAFYRVHENEIYVDRILYGRRDYLRILFENTEEK